MNPEIKARWVAALRSGEYKQGVEELHTIAEDGTEQFCCLGVLCDLAAKEGVVGKGAPVWGAVYYGSRFDIPPLEVRDWAGVEDANPDVRHMETVRPIAAVNDSGATFNEIADLIEAQL